MDVKSVNGAGGVIGLTGPGGSVDHEAVKPPVVEVNQRAAAEKVLRQLSDSENIDHEKLEITTQALNDIAKSLNRSLDFSVHDGTKMVLVKVVDAETKEVIREVPGEQFLNFIDRMHDFLGLLVDEEA